MQSRGRGHSGRTSCPKVWFVNEQLWHRRGNPEPDSGLGPDPPAGAGAQSGLNHCRDIDAGILLLFEIQDLFLLFDGASKGLLNPRSQ